MYEHALSIERLSRRMKIKTGHKARRSADLALAVDVLKTRCPKRVSFLAIDAPIVDLVSLTLNQPHFLRFNQLLLIQPTTNAK